MTSKYTKNSSNNLEEASRVIKKQVLFQMRVNLFLKRLEHISGILKEYDKLTRVSEIENPKSKEFFLPHRALVWENNESTKLRVIYNALAKFGPGYCFNDWLEKESSLQNKFWVFWLGQDFNQ